MYGTASLATDLSRDCVIKLWDFFSKLIGEIWYLSVVLVCTFLMTEVKHHFINLMATCISFFVNYPLKKNHTFGLFLLTCKSSLYFRMIKPKCDINCRKKFFLCLWCCYWLATFKKMFIWLKHHNLFLLFPKFEFESQLGSPYFPVTKESTTMTPAYF